MFIECDRVNNITDVSLVLYLNTRLRLISDPIRT